MRFIRFADLKYREDVRMVERGGGARLLFEAAHASGVPGELFGQQLDRDLAAELRILSQVDFAHPTSAQWSKQAVMRNGGIGRQRLLHLLNGRVAEQSDRIAFRR